MQENPYAAHEEFLLQNWIHVSRLCQLEPTLSPNILYSCLSRVIMQRDFSRTQLETDPYWEYSVAGWLDTIAIHRMFNP